MSSGGQPVSREEEKQVSELQPLDIVDDRTPEQVRADGDERWPDGTPYILRGVCCVCLSRVAEETVTGTVPMHTCLVKLPAPVECGMHELVQEPQCCTGLAYWAGGLVLTDMCDKCIIEILEHTPDNRDWLTPALADIRQRHLKIGARVRIQCIAERGQLGTIYRAWHDQSSWYVRVDRRPADNPGIVCMPDELDVLL